MTVKRSTRKQATPLHRKSSNTGWLTGLLVGLVIGGGVVFYLLAIQPKTPVAINETPNADVKKDSSDKKKSSGPRFDFYKLLPENASGVATQTSPTPMVTTAPTSAFDSDNEPSPTATTATTGTPVETHAATADSKIPGAYLLQAGSFRTATDADKVRANILLLGLPSRVESAQNAKGETLYRVYVGSFNTPEEMKKAQDLLAKNKMNAVVVKSK